MARHGQAGDGQKRKANQCEGDVTSKIPEHIRKSVFFLKDYVLRTDREPIVGLDQVLEYRLQVQPDKMETKYYCDMCELDCDLEAMMEHLCSFRHRKLYMSRQYPFILKASSSSKENRSQFMRRMATEIEEEEGTKMYKSYPTIRTEPMMNAKPPARKSKFKSRWDAEGDREKRMKKALEYLQSFEIDNDTEASTVTRLTEKLTAELKFYSDSLKQQALFPVQAQRTKAMSVMQNTNKAHLTQQNPMHKSQPPPNKGLPSGPAHPNVDKPYWAMSTAYPQRSLEPAYVASSHSQNYQTPTMPIAENIRRDQTVPAEQQANQTPEDLKFLKKLITLLKVLPENKMKMENPQMNSKLMMLKSLLQDKSGSMAGNQLAMQLASLTQDTAGMDNTAPNQPLTMSSRNMGGMGQLGQNFMMQVSSMANNAAPMENMKPTQNAQIQMAALRQNSQRNVNSLSETRSTDNQQYMQMGSSMMPIDQSAYQKPYTERQSCPDGRYSREWGESSYSNNANKGASQGYNDYTTELISYPRICLSPGNQRSEMFQDEGYRSQESRSSYSARSSRSYDDPAWAERESDLSFGKRAKLDGDHMTPQSTDQGKQYPDRSGSADAANLSAQLLKKIRGKDLFTVSAILSEYADNRSPK